MGERNLFTISRADSTIYTRRVPVLHLTVYIMHHNFFFFSRVLYIVFSTAFSEAKKKFLKTKAYVSKKDVLFCCINKVILYMTSFTN